MQKTHIFFCTRLCQSFSWVCCSFPDYLEQLKKKRNNLRDWVHTSVVWMIFSYILIIATSSAGNINSKIRSFTTILHYLINLLLHTSALGCLWNVRVLKILWKIKHLLLRSKCSIFHNKCIFKTIEMYKIFFGKYLKIWIFYRKWCNVLKIAYGVSINEIFDWKWSQ